MANVDFKLAQPQDVPLTGLNDGLQKGLGIGLGFQRQRLAEDQMNIEKQQRDEALEIRRQQVEQEKEAKTLSTLKTKSEILSQPWFRRLHKDKKNEFFKGYIGDVNSVLGTDYDGDGQFDDGDSDVAADIDKILSLKNLSPADKKAAMASRILAAMSAGEEPKYLADIQKAAEFGLTPQETEKPDFTQENRLRGDFEQGSKSFKESATAYRRILDSAKDPSAAGDLGLIFGYMKLLDPTSTVREGEFATAQNAGSIPQSIQAQYNKAISGERLAPELRKDFVSRARSLYKGQEANQLKYEDQFRGMAQRYNADPNNVVLDYRTNDNFDEVFPADGQDWSDNDEIRLLELEKKLGGK